MAKILFISASLGFGGAAKMLIYVAESLANRGHEVHIANLRETIDVAGYEREVNPCVEIHHVCNKGRIKTILSLIRLAKNTCADIVVGFTLFPNMYASIVGAVAGIPSAMSERGDPQRTGVGVGIKDKIALAIINRCTGGVFQTEGAKVVYGQQLKDRSVVIPNPIFVQEVIEPRDHLKCEKTVVSVGRLDNTQKRYDIMLSAFKRFVEIHPEYSLHIYGRGTDEEQIAQWIDEYGLGKSVRLMGLTTNPMGVIAKAGMFIITSDYEGISNSLLEAMAVGLPCISTDHSPGGARLLIEDHQNGLLVPIQDVDKLTAAMCEFAENIELAETCGTNAKDVVKRFEANRIIDMWEDYLCGLAKK